MYIVMIASECAPVAKVGGLGDVVFGLSGELEKQGHGVEIIIPKYDCMRYDHIWGLTVSYQDLWVPWDNGVVHCTVWFGFVHGRRCFFIEPHSSQNYFNRGHYYGALDEAKRFAFFSKAALEFMLKTNKRPDIIHCHDWQTGLVPVLLYEIYKYHGMWNQRVCYTIHNFKHQGIAGPQILWETGLNNDAYYYHYDRLLDNFDHTAINFMKGGIVYSNYVNTVSPHHAWEARHGSESYGLGHTLYIHQNKFGGILNGIDYHLWNPDTDPLIPYHYSIDNFENKALNKKALRERLWLRPDENKPLIAYVGRLDEQKGVHLIRHGLFYALHRQAQFVLLGSSTEPWINSDFWHLKHHLNDNPDCHLELGYNEELAHLIYAGADIIIVPSNYEPCGLTQMIALRYGTVPVVRGVGGLVSTVFDRDYDQLHPPEERNGYVFYQADYHAIESAMERAIGLWQYYPEEFKQLAINGMKCDYSWARSVQDYINVYEYIRHK